MYLIYYFFAYSNQLKKTLWIVDRLSAFLWKLPPWYDLIQNHLITNKKEKLSVIKDKPYDFENVILPADQNFLVF